MMVIDHFNRPVCDSYEPIVAGVTTSVLYRRGEETIVLQSTEHWIGISYYGEVVMPRALKGMQD